MKPHLALAAALLLAAAPSFAQTVPPVVPSVPGASVVPLPLPPVPGATVAVPGTGFQITSSSYVLAPADQIDVSVQGHEDLHQSAQILNDGTFNYPIVGAVHAAGMTVAQLTEYLTRGLSDQYNQPVVTVVVRDSHARGIVVSGIARSPATYPYRPGITLLEVLAASGGSTQPNNLTQATLVTTDGQGGRKSVPVDLVKLFNADAAQNVTLKPGDSVLLSPRDPASAEVQVIGQVGRPGQFEVAPEGATLIAMITQAGGATSLAALSRVQIVHNGRFHTVNLHGILYNVNDPAGQIQVVAGDTINVPLNNNHYTVYGEVRGPGVYTIPDGEPLPLTTAIGVAGGTTDGTDKRAIGIVRKTKTGDPYLTKVNLDETLRGESRVASLAIQPNDVIVVPKRRPGFAPLSALTSALGLAYSASQVKYLTR